MAAYLCRMHHIALHVSNVEKIAYDLVAKFKFNLFAARRNGKSRQLAFKKGSAVFIVNEKINQHLRNSKGSSAERSWPLDVDNGVNKTDLKHLYDVAPTYSVDTACNVCFEVEDVEKSFRSLCKKGCDFLAPPTEVQDDRGMVTYFIVKSIVGNVCHTLIDRSKYQGEFLPGFQTVENVINGVSPEEETSCSITHFDHITYACPRKSTPQVIQWYERNFGFQRFFIDSKEDINEGFVLDQDGIGLRLTAMEYWKSSEAGVKLPFKSREEPDCKFVIAESLPETAGKNQVDSFLEQHRGAGIQHVGLYSQDIVSTAHTLAQAGVRFFSPPPAYYTQVGKQQEIVDAGHDPQLLSQHGILLDTDVNLEGPGSTFHLAPSEGKRHLLQLFTKPIFAEDTLFLELIERRGASGFGEGNIRALWKSVQAHMESKGEGRNAARETRETGQR